MMNHDQRLLAQMEMHSLLDGLTAALVQTDPARFVDKVEQIRTRALHYNMTLLHDVASAMESRLHRALSEGGAVVAIRSYREAMRDAVACHDNGAGASEALLAHINLRLEGQP